MELTKSKKKSAVVPEFLQGGGELGERIRNFDWSETPLGAVDTWPQSLRTCIRIMLTSRQPIWIGWGKELIKFYNDPYKAIVGGKHPRALGQPASVVWSDIWRDIEPMLKTVMEDDTGTYVESQLLIMERNGYPEETYYTFSYTPIPGDDGQTAGMICANTDDTERIISERQLRTLTQLGKALTDSNSNESTIKKTLETLGNNPHDFPFALFYRIDNDKAILKGATDNGVFKRLRKQTDLSELDQLGKHLLTAFNERTVVLADDITRVFGTMPTGAWEITSDKMVILPIFQMSNKEPYGCIVAGFNPYRLLDDKYKSFFTLIADQIATSFADIHALEEERKRSEALAEIDRAKTTFFSNISHEFRTPLTLLLGPIEETLYQPENAEETRTRMNVAYRNALRLQRLVNTLLEFSRIEAGRLDGKFTKIDITAYTNELASSFKEIIEKAGIRFVTETEDIDDEVYADPEMWERIVLNLLSNAFKYTKEGHIRISLHKEGNQAVLQVEDSGIGIPPEHIDKVFQRFHRIENSEGRSKEGTGIGLAMVKELIRIHNGTIDVQSQPGKGSVFTVRIPLGKHHIDEEKIIETDVYQPSRLMTSLKEEADRWNPTTDHTATEPEIKVTDDRVLHTIVLADDNADMREYISRLLNKYYRVITASNGQEAYALINEHQPALVLSDIMMPKLDGFGLLKRIRENTGTKNIPVIFLSARAGEESKVEGLEAGADDYLVKPFSAKELIARVDANIRISRNRLASEQNLRNIIMQSPFGMSFMRGRDYVIELVNEKSLEILGRSATQLMNKPAFEVFPELKEQGFKEILDGVYNTGIPFKADEMPVELLRYGKPETIYVNFIYQPMYNIEGNIEGIISAGIDVTQQVAARKKIEQAEEKARMAIESADMGSYEVDLQSDVMTTSHSFNKIWGVDDTVLRSHLADKIYPEDRPIREKAHAESQLTGELHYEARIIMPDNSLKWIRVRGKLLRENDVPVRLVGIVQNITEQKRFTEELTRLVEERTLALKRSNQDLQQFAHVASHDLKEPIRKIKTFVNRLSDEYAEQLPQKAKEFISKIHNSSDRMIAMIEGVLNYSSLEAADILTEKIDLNALFGQISSDLELVIHEKNADVKIGSLPTIEGAPILIYQLFYNIVNNALKFLSDRKPLIEVSGREDGGFAEISITDNGIGFNNEFNDVIFKTFTRLHSKDQYEGTGLGLALCRKIAERHGGSIEAKGGNQGAEFIVRLALNQNLNI